MRDLIKAALFTPGEKGWGLPLLFWGDPGTAKSDIIRSVAREFSLYTQVLSPGARGEGAFGVTPVPVVIGDAHVTTYPVPDWTLSYDDEDVGGGGGVLFLDELNTAPPALQPALLGLLLDRQIGGATLSRRVRLLAAGNPTGVGTWDLSGAAANRAGHVDWRAPPAPDWSEWLLTYDPTRPIAEQVDHSLALVEEERVLAAWGGAFAKARGLMAGFIRRRPELLHVKPGDDDPKLARAWPSRRSWTMATRALASAEVHGLGEGDTDTFVGSFVGFEALTELSRYRTEANLPDPADVLDGKVKWAHDDRRIDKTMAVLSSCAMLIHSMENKSEGQTERARKMFLLLGKVADDAPDICVMATKPLSQARLLGMPEAQGLLLKMRKIVDMTGFGA